MSVFLCTSGFPRNTPDKNEKVPPLLLPSTMFSRHTCKMVAPEGPPSSARFLLWKSTQTPTLCRILKLIVHIRVENSRPNYFWTGRILIRVGVYLKQRGFPWIMRSASKSGTLWCSIFDGQTQRTATNSNSSDASNSSQDLYMFYASSSRFASSA